MTTKDNVRLSAELHAAFSEGKLESCLEVASDDIEVVFQAAGQTARGREGFLQFMQGFKTAFPDIVIHHTNAFAAGDQVAVEFTWSGTHTGPLATPAGSIPPTGRKVSDGKVCEIMTWRDGRVTRIVNYQDFGSVLRQLGVL
jgi:steroid delta-isomerase-like uncharacterized protein